MFEFGRQYVFPAGLHFYIHVDARVMFLGNATRDDVAERALVRRVLGTPLVTQAPALRYR